MTHATHHSLFHEICAAILAPVLRVLLLALAMVCMSATPIKAEVSASVQGRAELLIAQGRYQEATALLTEAGQTDGLGLQGHFLLGRAAMGAGEYDQAVKHFAAAVALDPNLPRLHYELARAYALQGASESAADEFRKVLAANPPPALARDIELYLAAVPGPGFADAFRATLRAGYLYDSNLNIGPSSDSFLIQDQNVFFGDISRKSDSAAVMEAELGYTLPIQGPLSWDTGLAVSHRAYFNESAYNWTQLTVATGPVWNKGRVTLAVPLAYDTLYVGSSLQDDHYSDSFGAVPQLRYIMAPNLAFLGAATLQHSSYYFATGRTGELVSGFVGVRWLPWEWLSITPGFRTIITNAREDYYAYWGNRFSLGVAVYCPRGWALYLRPAYTFYDYKGDQPLYGESRSDGKFELAAELRKELPWGFTLAGGYLYTNYDSNLALFDYERHEVTAMLEWSF